MRATHGEVIDATEPASFFDLDPAELEAFVVARGMPRHVARQLLEWVYRKFVVEPGAMSNVSRANRDVLARGLRFESARVETHQVATDGTEKLLLGYPEPDPGPLPLAAPPARQVECVMIPTDRRRTACISSQFGCPVGCRFCASGIDGVAGNLRVGQIVEQVHRLSRLTGGDRITNVVFMGMGEPLANFAAVTRAIRTINAPWGLGIGARKITVSTVGLPRAIHRLADFELPVTLALSLHAPTDDLRRRLIPWAEYAPLDALLDACDAYFRRTGREVTLEYLLLRGVNDRPEHATRLAEIARRIRANVNLIRYNEVRGLPFDRPTNRDVLAFQDILQRRRVNVHIRASRGRDIQAACGQLQRERRSDDRS